METSYIRAMSNFPILVKTPLIFPIPWAPAPFPKRGVRALYTDPFIRGRGGGVTRSNWRKKGSDSIFIYFLVLNLFDRWAQWFISGKTSSVGRGFNIFQRVQLLIPMQTYRTCNFPGGIQTPIRTLGCFIFWTFSLITYMIKPTVL